MDAWLRGGGMVVTASERASRALIRAFHRARATEGLTAWPTPNIRDWQSFVRTEWNERNSDGRIILNSLQEQSLWARIVAHKEPDAARLEGARHRLAGLAMTAHGMLCAHAPRYLKESTRGAWVQDAAAFSGWLTAFDEACSKIGAISAARLPLELIPSLARDLSKRALLMLAGFDRILPTQQKLLDAWGAWRKAPLGERATRVEFLQAADPATELAACALWCRRELAANPESHLLIVTQDVAKRRGEIERAFLHLESGDQNAAGPGFEFSLGVPLGQVELARGAALLLGWFDGAIEEHELDWLLSTGQIASSHDQTLALTAFMRALRDRGLQRTRWKLADFMNQPLRQTLPDGWIKRMTQAQRRLREAGQKQTPLAWAELVQRLLEDAGWPGTQLLTSAEFQVLQRWQQTIDDCASLGFDGRRIEWKEFLETLTRAADETLFASESQDAPIIIAGPAESAGLVADAVWFLGANEEAWPASGATHPLLPLALQREAEMPHASAKLDWDVAAAMTSRLLASAPEVHFSFARQRDGVDARPSRLIVQIAGTARTLPAELIAPLSPAPLTVSFEDAIPIPFPDGSAAGGSGILTAQSQCPFKAFAAARLGAEDWDAAEAGLTAKERGQLLHEVLHSIWGGPPNGIRTHAELCALPDPGTFVAGHVRRVLQMKMPARAKDSMPKKYLELEATRLIGLVTEWLGYEAARVPFSVVETEKKTDVSIAGLALKLRLDRIDRLNDGSLLVIDYKSGNVSPKSWDLPRPEDVQLPLYAGFALDQGEELGGMVFAKVRAGESKCEFAGRVKDAQVTLRSDLGNRSSLVQRSLDDGNMEAWRTCIEQLAREFLGGCAAVDPRDYPDTCNECGLQAICRVREHPPQAEDKNGAEDEDGDDA